MNKSRFQFGLVTALVCLGLVEAFSGFVLWLALPSGGGNGRRAIEQAFWGFTRHTWIDIHDWFAVALIGICVVHLAMHWKWVLRMVRSTFTSALGRRIERPVRGESVPIPAGTQEILADK